MTDKSTVQRERLVRAKSAVSAEREAINNYRRSQRLPGLSDQEFDKIAASVASTKPSLKKLEDLIAIISAEKTAEEVP